MNKTLYIVLMVVTALWYLGMTIVNAVAGNVGGAVGFGCTTVLALGLMFVALDLDSYIELNGKLSELNEKICDTSQEVCNQNRKLIDDNEKLFRTINKMKKYLTVDDLEEVNEEIIDTGYRFIEDDGEFELYVTKKRKEVSEG